MQLQITVPKRNGKYAKGQGVFYKSHKAATPRWRAPRIKAEAAAARTLPLPSSSSRRCGVVTPLLRLWQHSPTSPSSDRRWGLYALDLLPQHRRHKESAGEGERPCGPPCRRARLRRGDPRHPRGLHRCRPSGHEVSTMGAESPRIWRGDPCSMRTNGGSGAEVIDGDTRRRRHLTVSTCLACCISV